MVHNNNNNNNKQMVTMKLKNILACALGAGLLTAAAGSVQATVINNYVTRVLKAQLIIKWTDSNGKIKKATITSKDLVKAISEDFGVNYSGDQIVYSDWDGDYHLMDKNKVFVYDVNGDDLGEDGVIVADYTPLSSSHNDGNNGRYKDVETGTLDFEFYSDGVTEADVLNDDTLSLDDNTLEFIDGNAPYTLTQTGAAIRKNTNQKLTFTEKEEIGGVGHDFDVVDEADPSGDDDAEPPSDDDLPIFGPMTQDGSGTINNAD
jgi:hypothetical protein